jgi:hypothetical protein
MGAKKPIGWKYLGFWATGGADSPLDFGFDLAGVGEFWPKSI